MNWKVRLRNPVFWLTVLPALLTFLYTILGALDVVPFFTEDTALKVISTAVSALTAMGVLIDPTTKGVGDSERAMTYTEPN